MFEGSELSHGHFGADKISFSEKNWHFRKYIHIFSYFFRFLEKKIVFRKISEKK